MTGAGTLRGWWAGADRHERRGLAAAVALATVAALATPALLGLSGYLLARAAEETEILALGAAIVGVRCFGLLRATARYGERLVVHDLALARLGRVRVAVFDLLIPRVPGLLGGRTSSDALDAVVADVDRLADVPVRVLVPAASSFLAALACVTAAALVMPAAGAALALVLAAQALLLTALAGRDARLRATERSAARADLSRELVTLLDAAPELVAWGAAEQRAARVARAGGRLDRTVAAAARVASAGGVATILAAGAGALAMLAIGVPAAAAGEIDGVMVAALALLALGAVDVVGGAGDIVVARHEIAAAGRRLGGLAAMPKVASGTERPRDAGVTVRRLTLERAGRRILDGVDLEIEPGERVALTGASGAGKSTLADVLAGFAQSSAGHVRVGGVELERLDGGALRETVRWMPQEPHIFATSIAANVRIAAPDADDAALESALRAVGAGAWLDALPDGLATRLGEFGERCSGGERQRIGLARAYLCGGGLLILDEPASQLPRDEALAALAAVIDAEPGRGVLLVTHRQEEVSLADREVPLEATSRPERPGSQR
ncbi:MAG TPA: thiol reductant ABC exporter subunit CydC [Solirubrobacteraceae bacterium]|nr:thiol reductant ABC exporter subunit CydC [Solirubrobacteraceae bacterium]